MKNKIKTSDNASSRERSKKILIKFGAVFMSCILLVGVIFGAVGIVKNTRAVMKYKGVYLTSGVANYLSALYKYDFMSALAGVGIESYDSEDFWQSETEDGEIWADILTDGVNTYLKRIVIGNYLFDRNTRLNSDDKAVIEKAVGEVIDYRLGGMDNFNKLADEMGFTYRDFEKAVEMLYKYEMAEKVVFGYDGSALSGGGFEEECDEYFESAYSKVMLMFIRTDGEYYTDPETGKEEFSEYDDATKQTVAEEIAYIRMLTENANNQSGEQMNAELFRDYIVQDYPTGSANDTEGYYFSDESSYSLEFAQGAPEIVRLALTLEEGEYAECEVDFGVCFIYKCPLDERAYTRAMVAHFFADFYANASSYLYSKSLDTYITAVTVKNRYNSESVLTVPYSYELSVKFG